MPDTSFTVDKILSLLEETPKRIAALTDDLTPAQLRTAPGPGEWSAADVLAHLRACADVWNNAIITILAEDHPTIRAVSPRTWMKRTDYPELEFQSSFRAFVTQRDELLAVLKPLPRENWSRSATVTGAVRPRERTVSNYGERMVRHEREHIRQIEHIARALRTR